MKASQSSEYFSWCKLKLSQYKPSLEALHAHNLVLSSDKVCQCVEIMSLSAEHMYNVYDGSSMYKNKGSNYFSLDTRWSLSNLDALGPEESVLISEVSSFQGL